MLCVGGADDWERGQEPYQAIARHKCKTRSCIDVFEASKVRTIMINLIAELKLNPHALRQDGTRTVPMLCLPSSKDSSLGLLWPMNVMFRCHLYFSSDHVCSSCHLLENKFLQAFRSRRKISRRGFFAWLEKVKAASVLMPDHWAT